MRSGRCTSLSPALVACSVAVAIAFGASGFAAPSADAKAKGYFNFYGSSAHNAFSSARGHVTNYQRYLHETHGVPVPSSEAHAIAQPAGRGTTTVGEHDVVDAGIAREASDAIADDIERIQRHVNLMRAEAERRGDKQTIADLVDVDKQLGIARRGHAALHEHHAGETISPTTAMDLAHKVNVALRAAHAEHDEVMKRLGVSPTP